MQYENYQDYLKSDKWKNVKKDYDKNVFKRNPKTCACCGWHVSGEYHHFKYAKNWNADTWQNIIYLCSHCHKRMHNVFRKKQFDNIQQFLHALGALNRICLDKYQIALCLLAEEIGEYGDVDQMVNLRFQLKANGDDHVL